METFLRLREKTQAVSEDPRTPAKTLVNDLANSGIGLPEKTDTRVRHRNDGQVADQENSTFAEKTPLSQSGVC